MAKLTILFPMLVAALMFIGCAATPSGGGGGSGFVAETDASSKKDSAIKDVCTPDCDAKECGDDGCGGVCAKCPAAAPNCVAFACQKEALGSVCGDGKCDPVETPTSCEKDCACAATDNSCLGLSTANLCNAATGKFEAKPCNQTGCDAAKLGKTAGCGKAQDGTFRCVCDEAKCGDGICQSTESKQNCALDCGAAPVANYCDEHCGKSNPAKTCYCDNLCAKAGDCCTADGGKASLKTCSGSTCGDCNGSQPMCGDGKCEGTESSVNCIEDCAAPASCGDSTCDDTETPITCPSDCPCGAKDSFCDSDGNSLHWCTSGKFSQLGCAKACGDVGKTFTKCGTDVTDGYQKCFCKLCGNGKCEFGESYANCSADCACTDSDNTCSDPTTLNFCNAATGKLKIQICSQPNCDAANLGKSLGCGKAGDGTTACVCKNLSCGDGICQGNETKSSCPADCKSCTANSDCNAQVCSKSVNQCVATDGADYIFLMNLGTVAAKDKDGNPWDSDGTLPDSLVEVWVDSVLRCKTAVAYDTLKPLWLATCPSTKIFASSKVDIYIYDYDQFSANDFMDGAELSGANLMKVLNNGSYSGFLNSDNNTTIAFNVVAQ